MTLPTGKYRPIFRSTLLRALLLSLGLHGLLLAPAPAPWPRAWLEPGRVPLRARLAGGEQRVAHSAPLSGGRERDMKQISAPPSSRYPTPAAESMMAAQGGNAAPLARMTVGEAVDAEGLRGYRMALAQQARRFWRYPEAARQAGQQGTVQLRLVVLPLAGVTVSLEHSSGHDALDEAALIMVRQASVSADMPDSLRGQRFSLVLPVVFSPE